MKTESNDSSPSSQPSAPDRAAANHGSSTIELIKAILEFISKSFYPVILVGLIWLLKPTFSEIDFKKLVDRLQSAKAGSYEFTFNQAQDVGAEIAPLNNKLVELERALTTLQVDLKRLQEDNKVSKPSDEQLRARQEAEKKFQANSAYTALVFHRSASRRPAKIITDALLQKGYRSSDTETDFSELQNVKPEPNVVFITHTPKGQVALPEIEELIKSLNLDIEVRHNPRPIDLRRGDLQILVF